MEEEIDKKDAALNEFKQPYPCEPCRVCGKTTEGYRSIGGTHIHCGGIHRYQILRSDSVSAARAGQKAKFYAEVRHEEEVRHK